MRSCIRNASKRYDPRYKPYHSAYPTINSHASSYNHSGCSVRRIGSICFEADWGYQKVTFLRGLPDIFPIVDITQALVPFYARIDAYSQNALKSLPLGMTHRNMGKNDLWIAATALHLDVELHTTDNDFDHLKSLGLRLVR